ncbi:AbrB/MazE/SpoVT family DNA-binding domain-containing protein [Paenalcaligenes suwonensis]|uniref:AbrB/MazE/SpoVT family DNA-binding domain-containing protein n=1 Tax=Paenalcaligenes suwonensis TaxID=1202713 RepID=UPI001407C1B2|nr:AbrB/MazE/SpoVT family DNA-binding domain-containing protein [Paenalcaligenes suwonensis]NHC60941.1 AbrB/MazE/SpoVT family DNA-binding domain-containing protein [Paenalcaligenes suwonensis]
MTTLTVTAKGQITLKRDLLQHIGIQQGQKVEVVKLPDGELRIKAKQQIQPISNVFGLLKDKTSGKVVSLEDMNQAVAAGWAGEK